MKRYVAESFSRLFAGCNFFFLFRNSLYREQFFQSRDDFEKTWNYREKFISKSAVLFDWKRVLSYQILLREKEREDERERETRRERKSRWGLLQFLPRRSIVSRRSTTENTFSIIQPGSGKRYSFPPPVIPLHNHYYPMIAQTQISGNRWG